MPSSGVLQYYQNTNSLNKLLAAIQKARVNELGKLAALEYERFLEKEHGTMSDYTNTIKRVY